MPEDIIRLCVGIEDASDLIDDLSRAVSYILTSQRKLLFADSNITSQLVQAGAVTLSVEGFHANEEVAATA